jgi:hypothetical protein
LARHLFEHAARGESRGRQLIVGQAYQAVRTAHAGIGDFDQRQRIAQMPRHGRAGLDRRPNARANGIHQHRQPVDFATTLSGR